MSNGVSKRLVLLSLLANGNMHDVAQVIDMMMNGLAAQTLLLNALLRKQGIPDGAKLQLSIDALHEQLAEHVLNGLSDDKAGEDDEDTNEETTSHGGN